MQTREHRGGLGRGVQRCLYIIILLFSSIAQFSTHGLSPPGCPPQLSSLGTARGAVTRTALGVWGEQTGACPHGNRSPPWAPRDLSDPRPLRDTARGAVGVSDLYMSTTRHVSYARLKKGALRAGRGAVGVGGVVARVCCEAERMEQKTGRQHRSRVRNSPSDSKNGPFFCAELLLSSKSGSPDELCETHTRDPAPGRRPPCNLFCIQGRTFRSQAVRATISFCSDDHACRRASERPRAAQSKGGRPPDGDRQARRRVSRATRHE